MDMGIHGAEKQLDCSELMGAFTFLLCSLSWSPCPFPFPFPSSSTSPSVQLQSTLTTSAIAIEPLLPAIATANVQPLPPWR